MLSAGRIIGVLLIVQSAVAYVVNFVLLAPVMTGSGFLANAAPNASRVQTAVLLALGNGAVTLGIAITAWPIFRRQSEAMALWFLALAGIGVALIAVENGAILTMLSMSQEYAKAGAATQVLPVAALVARWGRYWAHYIHLLAGGGMTLVLYGTLLRFALVPRIIGAVGVPAVLLQMTAVALPIFGYPIQFQLLAPIGICHLALALWLIAKGFAEKPGTQYALTVPTS